MEQRLNPARNRAFTLLELLVVAALLSILGALVVPIAGSVHRALATTSSGQKVQAKLHYARQTAIATSRSVEVRFLQTPSGSDQFNALHLFICDEGGANKKALDTLTRLPAGYIICRDPGGSTILEYAAEGGSEFVPESGECVYKSFRFTPSGATTLDAKGAPASGGKSDTWFVTIKDERGPGIPSGNFYTIQVDPYSGGSTVFRR